MPDAQPFPRQNPDHGLPFRAALPAVLLLSCIFFFNYLSRIALAPLMPAVEADLGLSHGAAGGFFMYIALGNALGLLGSGLISSRLGHRLTIAASILGLGLAATGAALAPGLGWFRTALLGMGVCAGIYLPSGIASLMSLVRPANWGTGVAVHQMAPNLAFVAAPLLAEAVLALAGWRQALLVLGLTQLALGLVFLRFGRGGADKGNPPSRATVAMLVRGAPFWLLALCFGLASGGSFASFSMLPLYLTDQGWARTEVNQLLALSRLLALFMTFMAGWMVDRLGARSMMAAAFGLNALALAGLGFAQGPALTALVAVQPVLPMLFFPAGFTALSRTFGPETRSLAVSFITPLSILFGIGLVPWAIGHLGDAGLFWAGFGLLAVLELVGVLLSLALRFPGR